MAMYYTRQQLQGAGRYTGKCRVGNWNEDQELSESTFKDYLKKRSQGNLKLDKCAPASARAALPPPTRAPPPPLRPQGVMPSLESAPARGRPGGGGAAEPTGASRARGRSLRRQARAGRALRAGAPPPSAPPPPPPPSAPPGRLPGAPPSPAAGQLQAWAV